MPTIFITFRVPSITPRPLCSWLGQRSLISSLLSSSTGCRTLPSHTRSSKGLRLGWDHPARDQHLSITQLVPKYCLGQQGLAFFTASQDASKQMQWGRRVLPINLSPALRACLRVQGGVFLPHHFKEAPDCFLSNIFS